MEEWGSGGREEWSVEWGREGTDGYPCALKGSNGRDRVLSECLRSRCVAAPVWVGGERRCLREKMKRPERSAVCLRCQSRGQKSSSPETEAWISARLLYALAWAPYAAEFLPGAPGNSPYALKSRPYALGNPSCAPKSRSYALESRSYALKNGPYAAAQQFLSAAQRFLSAPRRVSRAARAFSRAAVANFRGPFVF